MTLKEKILLRLSKNPSECGVNANDNTWTVDNALSQLCDGFPNFLETIKDKTIFDFGCGQGLQAIALAQNGAEYVVGIDTNAKNIAKAREISSPLNLDNKLNFYEKLESNKNEVFDIVLSQNSMEHFKNPEDILDILKKRLTPNGKIFITFGPPWFAPYGSHMQFFTKVPWVNIFFDEKTVMKVRSKFRNDGAMRYEDVESGLNKMTVAKFERLVKKHNLGMEYKRYECVKKMNFMRHVPFFRELFINQISCILVNPVRELSSLTVCANGGISAEGGSVSG